MKINLGKSNVPDWIMPTEPVDIPDDKNFCEWIKEKGLEMKTPEELAEEYEKRILDMNPDGFTVASYVNGDVLSTAWMEGYHAALNSEAVKKLAECVSAVVKRYETSMAKSGSDLARGCTHGNYHILKESLAQFKALTKQQGEMR